MLDEPTNDLDIETLELLEEILLDFSGTVLLVSHDRAFMDNVVTSLYILDGSGAVEDQVGGYSDWIARGGSLSATPAQASPGAPAASAEPAKPVAAAKNKLSYKDQRELEALPGLIESLEGKQQALEGQMSAPGFYEGDHAQTQAVLDELAEVQQQLETAYERWSELD